MLIGLVCGYCEGRVEMLLQRVMDAVQAIPGFVLALALVSATKRLRDGHGLSAQFADTAGAPAGAKP